MVTNISPRLIPLTGRFEGKVKKAYRDAGGVITIGYGFTSMSKIFNDYWVAKHQHKLKMGDTITDAECDSILNLLLSSEYGPPVLKRFGPILKQEEFDAAADFCYNAGPGGLKDKWTAELAKGNTVTAAGMLKKDRITAGGKVLKGLINRRTAEANLMLRGDYGAGVVVADDEDEIREYQEQLRTLGYFTGTVDGKKATSDVAVRKFQADRNLTVDGDVGPATRTALAKAIENRRALQGGATATAGGGAVDAGVSATSAPQPVPTDSVPAPTTPPTVDFDWSTVSHSLIVAAIVAAVAVGLFLLWRYRGVILRQRTPVK